MATKLIHEISVRLVFGFVTEDKLTEIGCLKHFAARLLDGEPLVARWMDAEKGDDVLFGVCFADSENTGMPDVWLPADFIEPTPSVTMPDTRDYLDAIS